MNRPEAVVKLLLADNGDINVKDNNGQTPLSWAAKNEQKAVVRQMLNTGEVDVDVDTEV
jgi:ankyrin repeat protein